MSDHIEFEVLDTGDVREIAWDVVNELCVRNEDFDDLIKVVVDMCVRNEDFHELTERVAHLEAVNAKLLDTLGQFSQLLSHRDLI